jgi:hypothetical protein
MITDAIWLDIDNDGKDLTTVRLGKSIAFIKPEGGQSQLDCLNRRRGIRAARSLDNDGDLKIRPGTRQHSS